jgi:uncharacterized protein YggE
MKHVNVLVGAAAAALLLGGFWLLSRPGGTPAYGQAIKAGGDKDDKHEISVSGTGTVRVQPDLARLYFTVESYAEQIGAARSDNAGKVQKILKVLGDLQIPKLKTKSDNVSVQQLTENNNGRQLPRVIGYHVTNTFTVLVENEDRAKLGTNAGRVLDSVLQNGGTGVSQIMFFKKGLQAEQLRREAMTKAVQEALANGRALLAGMDKTRLEPLTVAVAPQYRYGGGMQNAMFQRVAPAGGGEATATALVAGDLEFTCTVNLTCRY